MNDWSAFTPTERRGIRRVIRRLWWRRLWRNLTRQHR